MSAHHRARLGSPLRLKGSFELFGESRKLVQKNIWVFAPLFALPLVFSFHSWEWTPALGSQNGHWWTTYSWFGSGLSASSVPSYMWYGFIGFSFLWLIFVLAIGTIVQIMSQEAQLEVTEGRPLDFIRLWSVVKETGWQMFGLYLLIGLYVFVGLILFIIPGLIMLRRYFLAPYVLLDRRCSVKEAMERSADMTKPYSKYIWGVIGVMFLIGLLNVIPGIGWLIAFVLGMYYSVAPALRYQELKEAQGGRSRHTHQEPESASSS
jgi:uncharacterized membrane protein